jgi:hypothetical protein
MTGTDFFQYQFYPQCPRALVTGHVQDQRQRKFRQRLDQLPVGFQ